MKIRLLTPLVTNSGSHTQGSVVDWPTVDGARALIAARYAEEVTPVPAQKPVEKRGK